MMQIENFVERVRERLVQPLPGLDVQMEMAPGVRGKDVEVPDNAKLSAILALLYPHNGKWFVPFMRRAEDGRVHGGQVSFPGGRKEDYDPDYAHTALRETEEEIGVSRDEIELIGPLSPIYIPPSNFLIYPQLGIAKARPDFVPDPVEVQDIIEVELEELLDERIKGMHRVDVFNGHFITAPGYTVNGEHLIWGGTAMMIAEFVQIMRDVI